MNERTSEPEANMQPVCSCGHNVDRAASSDDYRVANALLLDHITFNHTAVPKPSSKRCAVCEMALPTTRTREAENPLVEDDEPAVVHMMEGNGAYEGVEIGAGEGIGEASGPKRQAMAAARVARKDILGARLSVGSGWLRAEFKEKIMIACARAAAGKRVAPVAGTMCSRASTSEVRVEDVAISARA